MTSNVSLVPCLMSASLGHCCITQKPLFFIELEGFLERWACGLLDQFSFSLLTLSCCNVTLSFFFFLSEKKQQQRELLQSCLLPPLLLLCQFNTESWSCIKDIYFSELLLSYIAQGGHVMLLFLLSRFLLLCCPCSPSHSSSATTLTLFSEWYSGKLCICVSVKMQTI